MKKIGSKESSTLEFYPQFVCVGGDPVFLNPSVRNYQKGSSNKDVN